MAKLSPLQFYLIIHQPRTLLAALVNGRPTGSYMHIGYDEATVNEGALAGQTVWFGTSAGGREYGIVRLKDSFVSGSASGVITVAENDDVTPNVLDDSFLTIKEEFRLWPIYPRIVQTSDTEVVFYEDYDLAWNNQTVNWHPVAVAGPPAVGFLEGGTCTLNFIGDRSYLLAPSATGTAMTYLWTANESAEGTSAAQGTTGTPTTFTWADDGQYLVNLRVHDANNVTGTNYTWAFVIDPTDPTAVAYTDFDAFNDSMDFEQGGGECSFTVHGDCDIDDFPEGSLVVLACRGDLTTPDAGWPFRSNVLFVGHLLGDTIRQDPMNGDVSFRAATIDAVMRNTTTWPVSLTDKRGPASWVTASHLDVDRALSFLWHWRSTLSLMAPILPCEYRPEIARQDFAPDNLHANISGLMENAFGRVVCDHQGVLHHIVDHQLMLDTERAAKTTQKALAKAIWANDATIEERADYEWPVNVIKLSGIYYPGSEGEVVPLFSEAPGDAPKAYGQEGGAGSYILNTQAILNIRCGRMLGRDTQRYPAFRANFLNDGAFSIAPENPYPLTLLAADNDRALAWSPTLLARRISREYDHALGLIRQEVEFEPVVTGTHAGATVIMPPTPPDPELPTWDLPPSPSWTPPADPNAGPAVAADGAMGHYRTPDGGATWTRHVNGLDAATQLDFSDLIWDPWWRDKTGGHDPAQAILWGAGGGFVARSSDAGNNWQDYTIYLSDPPNTWGDATAPTKTDLTYLQIHGDIHNKDTFYLLAEWASTGSAWRGWLAKTTTDGLSWDWTSLGAPPTGYVAGQDYTFNFVEQGRQEWYADAQYCANIGSDPPVWEIYDSPCANAVQWVARFQTISGERWMPLRYPFKLSFSSTTVTGRRPLKDGVITEYMRLRIQTSDDQVTWTAVDTQSGSQGSVICTTVTSGVAVADKFVRVIPTTYKGAGGTPDHCVVSQLAFTALTIHTGDVRPIRMDLDTEAGTQLYLTANYDNFLFLETWDAATMNRVASVSLGAATPAQVTARTFWAAPHCPHQPGTADFGDNVYAFGRFSYTGTNRLGYSTDSGAAMDIIDEPTWGTGSTSWIGALETPATLEVLAVLNGAAELWRTTDHVTWAKLNDMPFDVDPAGVSRHWGTDADILAINRDAPAAGAGNAAVQQPTPYTAAWIAADGADLPRAGDGAAGYPAIIWV